MTAVTGSTYLCPDCRRAQLFEPTTPDDGAADSSEWACTVCGAALIVDPGVPQQTRRTHVA